jgi:hypothetical protein
MTNQPPRKSGESGEDYMFRAILAKYGHTVTEAQLRRDGVRISMDGIGTCDCWISKADDYIRFVTRCGAHDLTCRMYRASKDPVDRAEDERARAAALTSESQRSG